MALVSLRQAGKINGTDGVQTSRSHPLFDSRGSIFHSQSPARSRTGLKQCARTSGGSKADSEGTAGPGRDRKCPGQGGTDFH